MEMFGFEKKSWCDFDLQGALGVLLPSVAVERNL